MDQADNSTRQGGMEVEVVKVKLAEDATSQNCKICSAPLTSELGLLLHFREKHLEFFSDSDDDESESESDIESEEPETATLGFLTDYERALLQVPAFNPFSESEDELDTESASEDDGDNFFKLFDFEPEDFSRNARNGDDGKGAKDHRPPVEPGEPLPSSHDGPSLTSTEHTPSKRILPIRSCNQRTLLSTARDKRQLTLALLPHLQSHQKIGRNHNRQRRKPQLDDRPNGLNCKRSDGGESKSVEESDDDDKGGDDPGPKGSQSNNCLEEFEDTTTEAVLTDTDNSVEAVCNSTSKSKTALKMVKKRPVRASQVKEGRQDDLPFNCVFCGKGFPSSYVFFNHIRTHTKELPYFCKLCDRCYSQQSHLTYHMKIRHPGATPYKCKVCSKSFSTSKELATHGAVHRGEAGSEAEFPFKCSLCDIKCRRKDYLALHMRTHLKDRPREFECPHCKQRFYWRNNLNKHLTRHSEDKPFKCDHCKRGFARRDYLQVHVRTHLKEKGFKCEHCEMQFPRKSSKDRHERSKHPRESGYECEHCKKVFTRQDYLQSHLMTHSKELKFKCVHCEMRFPAKSAMDKHVRIHTRESRYVCDHCKQGFVRNDYLQRHLARFHNLENPNSQKTKLPRVKSRNKEGN